jgi:hypothetical protein
MPATKGNNFWEKRSKHGRNKLFATPKSLLDAAYEYFEWCTNNPLIAVDFKGGGAKRVELPKMRAFTMNGLCIFLGVSNTYFYDLKASLSIKKDQHSIDMLDTIGTIETIVYEQKFTGAAAGLLNPSIIARELGLADKKEQIHRMEEGAIVDWSSE